MSGPHATIYDPLPLSVADRACFTCRLPECTESPSDCARIQVLRARAAKELDVWRGQCEGRKTEKRGAAA